MAGKKPASITITKIEGARRQIEAAVTLWFQDGDPVVIHTLIAAGHQVCHDLIKARKKKSLILFNDEMFDSEAAFDAHKKIVLKLENFLKHAKKDPLDKITFRPEMTELYILDAIILLHTLDSRKNLMLEAFVFRFLLSRRGIFESFIKILREPFAKESEQLSRSEFLARYLKENG